MTVTAIKTFQDIDFRFTDIGTLVVPNVQLNILPSF